MKSFMPRLVDFFTGGCKAAAFWIAGAELGGAGCEDCVALPGGTARVPHLVQKPEPGANGVPQPAQNRGPDSAAAGIVWRVPQDVQNNCPSASETPHLTQTVLIYAISSSRRRRASVNETWLRMITSS